MESVKDKIQSEKDNLLNLMLLIFALVGTTVIVFSLLRALDIGMNASLWIQAIGAVFINLVFIFKKRLPYIFKLSFIIVTPLLFGMVGSYSFGMIDGSAMLLITAVIITATLLSIRGAIFITVFCALYLGVIYMLTRSGMHQFNVDVKSFMYLDSIWITYISAFTALSIVASILIGRMSRMAYKTMLQLEEQGQHLSDANASKDRLFQVIAHDLRSPFQGMIGGLEFFADEGDNFSEEQKQKLFKSMLRDATSTFSMLENLLFWSKVQIGELDIDKKYYEVDSLVNDALGPFERLARQKDISISKQLAIGTIVFADQSSVKTILSNLIHNAIKFSEKGGQILISAQTKGKETIISVSDSGPGISKADQQHLFDKQQVRVQRGTDKEKGTGLGLNLSYELALLNEGKIVFESNSQGGAVFILYLPAMPSGTTE